LSMGLTCMSEPNSPISTSTLEYYQALPEPTGQPPRERYWLHALLLLMTCFTTLVTGARMQDNFARNLPALSFNDNNFFPSWIFSEPKLLLQGLPFAASVMLFFLAHEMGHYLYCRRYGIYATLPFFIPMPTLIGTMGAVILIKSPIRSRRALFDIGIAGPIAGFVVALGLLLVSIGWSKPMPLVLPANMIDIEIGYPLIFQWIYGLLTAMNPGSAVAGLPLHRVLLHPVAIAAWVGMFATALNLLPGGQLDGGHILYSISPRAHRYVSRLAILILLPMAYYLWAGWIVWAILLQVSSLRRPQVAEFPRVSGGRSWLALVALFMLVCTLNAAPLGRHPMSETLSDLWQALHDLLFYLHDLLHHWLRH
jgi:membrane-associated protease RseP (regulator of RpoE activity)